MDSVLRHGGHAFLMLMDLLLSRTPISVYHIILPFWLVTVGGWGRVCMRGRRGEGGVRKEAAAGAAAAASGPALVVLRSSRHADHSWLHTTHTQTHWMQIYGIFLWCFSLKRWVYTALDLS